MPSTLTVSAERDLVAELRHKFIVARDHKRSRYDQWMRNYRLLNNRLGSPSSSWMPAPRDSEIYPIISALVGWMTDQNVMVDATPVADPGSPYYSYISDISNDLSNILYTNWIVEDYKAQAKLGLWDAFLYGAGIYKAVWDNSRSLGYGNALIRRTDPWAFYPDPHATSFDDMEYCVEVRAMSMDELERRFPGAVDKIEFGGAMDVIDEKPSLMDASGRIPLNPGNLRNNVSWGTGASSAISRWNDGRSQSRRYNPADRIVSYEYWLRENDEYDIEGDHPDLSERHVQEQWRVVVLAGGVVLMDELANDLWSHGQHPYERYVFDDIGEFYGIALVDHLAYPQLYINRLLTALQYNAELTGNPIFLEPVASGLDRVGIINRPGQRLPLRGASANRDNRPDWLKPPEMPKQVLDLVQFWIGRGENISGMSAIAKGSSGGQRTAEGVMSTIQEAAFVRVRSALSNYEATLERLTTKTADLIVDNYTEPRFTAIIGPDGKKTAMALRGRHFYSPDSNGSAPLKFVLTIQAGANSPTSRQARIAEADKLAAMGVIDDQAILETHQWPHIQEMLQRKYWKMQQGLWGAPGARQRAGRSK